MTIAREGIREICISTAILGTAAILAMWPARHVSPAFWALVILFGAAWVFSIAFFRDPRRRIPNDTGILVAPADGRVTEITRLDSCEDMPGPAIRIGIFLSVFDVHINRSPCAGRVISRTYRRGEFLDARHPECGIRNESNTISIQPADLAGPIIVRQIAGLIARRIICHLHVGDTVERGQRFGLIKFGSRTEVIVPADCGLEPAVSLNQHVKGGSTVLMVARRVSESDRKHEQRAQEPASAGAC